MVSVTGKAPSASSVLIDGEREFQGTVSKRMNGKRMSHDNVSKARQTLTDGLTVSHMAANPFRCPVDGRSWQIEQVSIEQRRSKADGRLCAVMMIQLHRHLVKPNFGLEKGGICLPLFFFFFS